MVKLEEVLNTAVEAGFDYVIIFRIDGEIGVAIGLNALHHKINQVLNEYIELMKNMNVQFTPEFYNVKGEKISFKDIPMIFSIEKDDTQIPRKGGYM